MRIVGIVGIVIVMDEKFLMIAVNVRRYIIYIMGKGSREFRPDFI